MSARLNIGGSSSSSSSSSSSMGGDNAQKIKLAAAVGILVVAGVAICWQMGLFESSGGGEAAPAPAVVAEAPASVVEPGTEDPNNPGRTFDEAPPAAPTRRGGGLVAPGYDPNAPENQPQPEPPPPPSDGG